MLKVTMHKAGNGDCISIENKSEFVLIDGGTAQSFSNWKSNIIDKDKIGAVIVTHIDNDHVNGIIKLLQNDSSPQIDSFYFNGAEQLFGRLDDTGKQDRLSDTKLRAISEELSTAGDREQIGYSEGTSLSYLLLDKKITSNPPVAGGAFYRERCNSFKVGDIKFSVIGPSKSVLQELKSRWEDKLSERGIRPKIITKAYYEAFEKYTKSLQDSLLNTIPIASSQAETIESLANTDFKDDNSVTNKSSLSFLIESNTKRLLYLSDSDCETIISWLDNLGINQIKVDAVKISHHGSRNNTSLELLHRINCKKYLISTNGNSHSHPDLETLARISLVNKESGAEIFMNYEVNHIPDWFTNELESIYPNIKLSINSCEVDL